MLHINTAEISRYVECHPVLPSALAMTVIMFEDEKHINTCGGNGSCAEV